jgi:ACS family pantothenate transporter-like MFS transporter
MPSPRMTTTTDTESAGNGDEIPEEKKKKPWVSYLWDTFDKPPEERKLLSKLDAAILSFASIGMPFGRRYMST